MCHVTFMWLTIQLSTCVSCDLHVTYKDIYLYICFWIYCCHLCQFHRMFWFALGQTMSYVERERERERERGRVVRTVIMVYLYLSSVLRWCNEVLLTNLILRFKSFVRLLMELLNVFMETLLCNWLHTFHY